MHLVEELNGSTVKARYLRGAGLICQLIDSNTFYYLFNPHGDVVQRIDQNGNAGVEYDYDAFGNNTRRYNVGYQPTDGLDTDTNPFRYCGEYWDTELGEIYLRNRSYAPGTGRFSSEDPIRSGGNWYSYASNNPIHFVDPSGLNAIIIDKPIEATEVGDQEHMSLLLEDSSGTWHYISYVGDELVVEPIEDSSVVYDLDRLNQYLHESGIVNADWKDFTRSLYLEGDFTKSLLWANEAKDDLSIMGYPTNRLDNIINTLTDIPGSNYSLFFHNCGHEAMRILSKGRLSDGSGTYGEIFRNTENQLNFVEYQMPGEQFDFVARTIPGLAALPAHPAANPQINPATGIDSRIRSGANTTYVYPAPRLTVKDGGTTNATKPNTKVTVTWSNGKKTRAVV